MVYSWLLSSAGAGNGVLQRVAWPGEREVRRNLNEVVGMRRATVSDLDDIMGIQKCVCGDSYNTTGRSANYWGAQLSADNRFIYLFESACPFGFVSAGPSIEDLYQGCGELYSVMVESQHRSKGYGRRLVVQGLSVLKRRGFRVAFVWLVEPAHGGDCLFRDLGFIDSGLTRQTNGSAGTLTEAGHLLDLSAFF